MKPKTRLQRRLPLAVLILFLAIPPLGASPARRGLVPLRQPDGSLVQAFLTGDETGHLMTTPDGCALVQDADLWWCYARFDASGNRFSSGVHAGAPDAPGGVIAASRLIPRSQIHRNRVLRRKAMVPLHARQRAKTRRALTEGTGDGVRHGLIILAQFQDLRFRFGREDFEKLINGAESASALSYFQEQWKGRYTFQFDITDIVTLPQNYAWYGANDEKGNDKHPAQMIVDACEEADPDIDFSLYDNDGDGEADNVFVFFAGPNEAENAGDNYIWPHMWYIQSGAGLPPCILDGVIIDNYACTSELRIDDTQGTYTSLAGIGTFCHEYTHTFGIADLYDSDGEDSGGFAEGEWQYIDLMDSGNHNNNGLTPPNYGAVEHYLFGIGSGAPLTEGFHTLRPAEENGDFLFLETDDDNEIFLFECRRNTGRDAFIGGSGLLIYHIDQSDREAGYSTSEGKTLSAFDRWVINEVNARPDHQCVDLIEPDTGAPDLFRSAMANHRYEAIYTLASHAFWPYGDRSVFTCDTEPAFRFWSGADAPLGLADIRVNPDGSVSFTVFNALDEKAPAVKIDRQTVFQDAMILQWSSVDASYTGSSFIRFGNADAASLTEVEVLPYAQGKYAYVMDRLSPTTAYKVQLLCRKGGVPGPVNGNACFTTKSGRKAGSYAYIYLKDTQRGTDGSFAPGTPIPLRVYNAPDATGVDWFFNSAPVFPGDDGYWHIPRSGELKAVVYYRESTETITKQLIVK